MRRGVQVAVLVVGLAVWAQPVSTSAEDSVAYCLRLERATAFSPRGEIYVDVQASCTPEDFGPADPIVAYVEVLLGNLPAVSEEVRIYADAPNRRDTLLFEGLSFQAGDSILVRLVRFGEILGLLSITGK